MILLNGESSRLYKRLVRDEQLALNVYGGISETIDPMLFTVYAKPRPGVDLNRLEAVIEEELGKIKKEGITDKEYQKAQNMIRSDFYFGLQTNSGKAGQLGRAEILFGSYEKLFTQMDNYAAVKREQIQEAANKYLTENNKTVGKLIPEGGVR